MAISSASRFPEALDLVTQAIARDRNYAPALGYGTICHFRAVTDCWSTDPEANTRKAIDYASVRLHSLETIRARLAMPPSYLPISVRTSAA